jgi:large subunit ribosomal protein L29
MKQDIISELSTADLKERLEIEVKQLTKLRINHAVSQLENPMKLRAYRKTIARIKTELRRREIEEEINLPESK